MKKGLALVLGGLGLTFALTYAFTQLSTTQKEEIAYDSMESYDLKESIDAEDSIFGTAYGKIELGSKVKEYSLVSSSLTTPLIGYQTALSDDNTKISIRYTAAITDLDVTATWTRALYDASGDISTEVPEGNKDVTYAYEAITNGGVITYANQIEDEDGNTPYNYFVVYTLLEIPLASYGDYYLDASLSISKDTNTATTRIGALKVDKTDFFSYEKASDYLTFTADTTNKEYTLASCNPEYQNGVVIPSHYSDGTHRYPVTTIGDSAFYNNTDAISIELPNTITTIGNNAFDRAMVDDLVLPSSIQTIGSDILTEFSVFDHICYMGDQSEWNTISIDSTNDVLNSEIIYYYDINLSACNTFSFDATGAITISTVAHTPLSAVEENVTATCTAAGTYDSVVYCSVCNYEISRETGLSHDALGHSYEKTTETTIYGHSHDLYTCSRCNDQYANNLSVDYTTTYEYQTFTTNALYQAYATDIASIYSNLYTGCMAIWNSEEDYTADWNGNSAHLIAEASYSTLNDTQGFAIANFFLDTNPQFYFISDSIYYGGNTVYLVLNPTYYAYTARKAVMDGILSVEEDFTRAFYQDTTLTTDILKAKFVHDYIADNLFYQYEEDGTTPSSEAWAHNIVGFMDLDTTTGGVCECYAKTYIYLTRLIGINAISVVGLGGGGGHAWNYTEIDGAWYGTDVTWDDQGSTGENTVYYDFFLASSATMADAGSSWDNASHVPGESDLDAYTSGEYFQVLTPTLSDTIGYTE